MPVIYMLNRQKSLCREPYASFDKGYSRILDELQGKEIELPVRPGKDGEFSDGFFHCDYAYQGNRMLKFRFAKVNPEQENTFVRCSYSIGYKDFEVLDYHLKCLKAIALRADYFYIPKAEYLEFSYQVDEAVQVYLDVIVAKEEDVRQVCHSMINQMIAIFSIED